TSRPSLCAIRTTASRSRSPTRPTSRRWTRFASTSARSSRPWPSSRTSGTSGGPPPASLGSHSLDQFGRPGRPGDSLETFGDPGQAALELVVAEEPVDHAAQLARLVVVGRQPDAGRQLLDPLGVVVLIPEEREDDHRLAEEEALRDRVVAAVSQDEVDLRQDPRLRQELSADHVVGELELVVLRAL